VKVLAWVPQVPDTSPGQRFRIEQWAPHLARSGIEVVYAPFVDFDTGLLLMRAGPPLAKAAALARALLRRVAQAWKTGGYQLLYVFREGALLGPALAERLLAWRGIRFVFDFDDAVWVRYVSPVNGYFAYLRFPGKTATLCRLSRHVIAGNSYLAQYAQRYNPRVTVVPTTIDTERYRRLPPAGNAVPVIGWTGSHSTAAYLRLVKPALERLRRRAEFRVVVVGGAGFEAEGIAVEHRPWRAATEVSDLADIDIGIMPLPDAEWERGKCGLKALQYMALGIPPVLSPVGVNADIVVDGENGLLARTEEEWERALERLITDPALRARLGARARATVEQTYSAAVQAPRVAAVFREAAG
jgi:glycosyltransferase involved in cell wall biosynthesis